MSPATGLRLFYFGYYGCVGTILPYFAPYLSGLGFSGEQIGTVQMIGPLVAVPTAIAWATAADRLRAPPRVLGLATAWAFLAVLFLPAARPTSPQEAPSQQQPPAPAQVVGGYFVQVGAFSDVANAQRVRDAVVAAGPVSIDVRRTASGAELFRVRVGPLPSEAEPEAARARLASLGYGDSIVAAR